MTKSASAGQAAVDEHLHPPVVQVEMVKPRFWRATTVSALPGPTPRKKLEAAARRPAICSSERTPPLPWLLRTWLTRFVMLKAAPNWPPKPASSRPTPTRATIGERDGTGDAPAAAHGQHDGNDERLESQRQKAGARAREEQGGEGRQQRRGDHDHGNGAAPERGQQQHERPAQGEVGGEVVGIAKEGGGRRRCAW